VPVLRVVYLESYPPFSWNEDGRAKGLLVEIAQAIGEELGLKVEHAGYPWKRAQEMVRNGEADSFLTVSTAERREYALVSETPVLLVSIGLFVPAESEKMSELRMVKSVPDLKGFSMIDYLGDGWGAEMLKGFDVGRAPSIEHVVQMLALNRGDGFLQNGFVTNYAIRRLGLQDKIVEIPMANIAPVPFSFFVSKQSPLAGRMADFDAAIKKLTENGRLAAISRKYE